MIFAKANHDNSALNLKMFDNGLFSVVLDNNASFSKSNYFSAPSIAPGYHKLKVTRIFHNPYGGHPVKKVVFKGWITIPPKSVVYAQIDCHNQFDMVKVEPYFCPPVYDNCSDDDWDDDCGYGSDYGYDGNGWCGTPVPPVPPVPPAPACISHMEFIQLKSSIENKSFESSKLQIAKQALAYHNFSSAQVADLMSVFDFETTKLDFAKSAYPKIVDRQNFYLVNNAFAFESSIQDMNQFVAMGK